ncbi:uncharacterized protein CIMG_00319 [Coccidioides immitis RS]|uniref:Uncharacterized protein n=1 Tax=Coccidioides immitis (strain RS) TaxID=246410 RepID=J3KGR1_COCIM|nr:uncharacterized protein CIMG_00319 [Coccidioides immitis RS]EAS34965.3 hypothetical protein CIMG_00319 [Coccidioides immitis RS]
MNDRAEWRSSDRNVVALKRCEHRGHCVLRGRSSWDKAGSHRRKDSLGFEQITCRVETKNVFPSARSDGFVHGPKTRRERLGSGPSGRIRSNQIPGRETPVQNEDGFSSPNTEVF